MTEFYPNFKLMKTIITGTYQKEHSLKVVLLMVDGMKLYIKLSFMKTIH